MLSVCLNYIPMLCYVVSVLHCIQREMSQYNCTWCIVLYLVYCTVYKERCLSTTVPGVLYLVYCTVPGVLYCTWCTVLYLVYCTVGQYDSNSGTRMVKVIKASSTAIPYYTTPYYTTPYYTTPYYTTPLHNYCTVSGRPNAIIYTGHKSSGKSL